VGKSTLLNALVPGTRAAHRRGQRAHGKGRHTTTAATLFRLEDGTEVIDTPGVRAFGLPAVAPSDLAAPVPRVPEPRAVPLLRLRATRRSRAAPSRAALEGDARGPGRYAAYLRLRAELEGAAPPRDAVRHGMRSKGRR
jgi:ribosome biogenesis GTPase